MAYHSYKAVNNKQRIMKKLIKSIILTTLATAAFTSCNKVDVAPLQIELGAVAHESSSVAPHLVLKNKETGVLVNQLSFGFTHYSFVRTYNAALLYQYEHSFAGYAAIYVANRPPCTKYGTIYCALMSLLLAKLIARDFCMK